MLEVRNVSVAFGPKVVLDDVNLEVAQHEIVALTGSSGGGKSSLLRVIAGIISPDRGHVLLNGTDITGVPTHRRNIGMVFQDEQLFPHRNVHQNVEFGLRMRGWSAGQRQRRVEELLHLVNLDGLGPRQVTSLSGGEAKRVALIRTLAPKPDVVLLDEPLTGLDRDLHDQLAADLATLLRATQTTAILVTHDHTEAEQIASRTVRLADLSSQARH